MQEAYLLSLVKQRPLLQGTPNLEVTKVEVVGVRNAQLVALVVVGRTPGQSTSRANMLRSVLTN